VIRLTIACDGAAGHARLGECKVREDLHLDGYGDGPLMRATDFLKASGWSFRHFGTRLIVRCPECERLRVARNAARAKRDKLREARSR
jgi:hypothetical protein